MNPTLIFQMVIKYGPEVVHYLEKYGPDAVHLIAELHDWISTGKHTVTADDLKVLADLAEKTSQDYLDAAGGPPAKPGA